MGDVDTRWGSCGYTLFERCGIAIRTLVLSWVIVYRAVVMKIKLILAASMLLLSGQVSAAFVQFSGSVQRIIDNGDHQDISVGSLFSGYYFYELDLVNSDDIIVGEYLPTSLELNKIHVEIGSLGLSKGIERIGVWNDRKTGCNINPECHYTDQFFINGGNTDPDSEEYIQFKLSDSGWGLPVPSLLSSSQLPSSALNPDNALGGFLSLKTDGLHIEGTILSVVSPSQSPQPSGYLALAFSD
jgi:hypothetical protein